MTTAIILNEEMEDVMKIDKSLEELDFASLDDIFIGITKSTVGLKIYAITTALKKYNSITKKTKKNHGEIILAAETKFKTVEVLISNV